MTQIAPHTRATARRLRRDMTPQERKLWPHLRDLNRQLGLNFRRQAPVGRFIADFAELGQKLVIEIDGSQHGGPEDAQRDMWFGAQGFVVLRFWNNDVDENLVGVMEVILDAIGVAPHPLTPPHKGEGRHTTDKGCER